MEKDHSFTEPIIMLLLLIIMMGNQSMHLKMGNILLQVITLNEYMIQGLLPFSQGCGAIRADHQEIYKEWGRIKGTPIQITDQSGEKKIIKKPQV